MHDRVILDKYEVLEMIGGDQERISFKGRDTSNSTDVVLHILKSASSNPGVKPELATIADMLVRSGRFPGLIFTGEREGKFYIVTESRPECHDIRRWLEQNSAIAPTPQSPDVS